MVELANFILRATLPLHPLCCTEERRQYFMCEEVLVEAAEANIEMIDPLSAGLWLNQNKEASWQLCANVSWTKPALAVHH